MRFAASSIMTDTLDAVSRRERFDFSAVTTIASTVDCASSAGATLACTIARDADPAMSKALFCIFNMTPHLWRVAPMGNQAISLQQRSGVYRRVSSPFRPSADSRSSAALKVLMTNL